MKTYSITIYSTFLCWLFITSCTKDQPPYCNNCVTSGNPIDELTIDYPTKTTPGYFTIVRAHLNGEVTYPVIVRWYDHLDQYVPSLLQLDTLTSGTTDWYTFNFPAIFKSSPFSNADYEIKCVVTMKNREGTLEKTIRIGTTD